METLTRPKTVGQAIKNIVEFGNRFAIQYAPQCELGSNWKIGGGKIIGPSSSTPNDFTNEQWVNYCMEEYYKIIGISSIAENAYLRFVPHDNADAEYKDAIKGIYRTSINHRNDTHEPGKSVSFGPFFNYFVNRPCVLVMRGDLLKNKCSDGAPLLAINENLEVVGSMLTSDQALKIFYEKNKDTFQRFAKNARVSVVSLFLISLGLWDNYIPSAKDGGQSIAFGLR